MISSTSWAYRENAQSPYAQFPVGFVLSALRSSKIVAMVYGLAQKNEKFTSSILPDNGDFNDLELALENREKIARTHEFFSKVIAEGGIDGDELEKNDLWFCESIVGQIEEPCVLGLNLLEVAEELPKWSLTEYAPLLRYEALISHGRQSLFRELKEDARLLKVGPKSLQGLLNSLQERLNHQPLENLNGRIMELARQGSPLTEELHDELLEELRRKADEFQAVFEEFLPSHELMRYEEANITEYLEALREDMDFYDVTRI